MRTTLAPYYTGLDEKALSFSLEDVSEEDYQQYSFRYESEKGIVFPDVPGPYGYTFRNTTNTYVQWRGPEPFAGDQIQSPLTDSRFGKQFIDNCAFYREGLKPWQRGLEIGMAHGYFIIGPFVSLGPLRNTPEAATVGLLAGSAVIGIASVGGLIFSQTAKPNLLDEPGRPRASGFAELMNWHAVGGLGGAGFAHALITVFGS